MSESQDAPQDIPRWVRRFVYWFLGLLLLCGFARIEAWPFTGFRLFSSLRSSERVSWQIVAVDSQDREEIISLAESPIAYRNTTTIIADFDDMTSAERDQVCDAWARPYREHGQRIELVRIYRKTSILREDPPPPSRVLMWECGG